MSPQPDSRTVRWTRPLTFFAFCDASQPDPLGWICHLDIFHVPDDAAALPVEQFAVEVRGPMLKRDRKADLWFCRIRAPKAREARSRAWEHTSSPRGIEPRPPYAA